MDNMTRRAKTALYGIFALFAVLVSLTGVCAICTGRTPGMAAGLLALTLAMCALGVAMCAAMPHEIKRPGVWLGGILLLTLVLRIAAVCVYQPQPVSDFLTYHEIAQAMVHGGMVHEKYIAKYPHVIGYASVLSLLYRVFGAHVAVAQGFNIVLCCIIGAEAYAIGTRIAGVRAGVLWAALLAVFPSMVLYSTILASEMLFTALLLLAILLFMRLSEKRSMRALLAYGALGLLLAFCNAVRPVGPVLLIAFLLTQVLFTHGKLRWKAVCAVVLLTVYAVAGALFTSAVGRAAGRPVHTSAVGYTIFVGTNVEYGGTWNEYDAHVSDIVYTAVGDEQKWNRAMLFMTKERLRQYDIMDYVRLIGGKFGNLWGADDQIVWYIKNGMQDTSGLDRHYTAVLNLVNAAYYAAMLFVLPGLYAVRRRRGTELPMLLVLGFAGMYMLTEASGRYTYTALLLLLFFSAQGLSAAGQRARRRKQTGTSRRSPSLK